MSSRGLKQLLIGGAIIAIIFVFVVQFRPGTNVKGAATPSCVVEVSGDCIPYGDYITAYRLAAPNVEGDELKQLKLKRVIVEGLIERWMLVRDAERLGVTVTSDEVTRYIKRGGLARFSLPVAQEDIMAMMLARYHGGGVLPYPYGPAKRLPVMDPKTAQFDYERYQKWVQRASGKTEKDFKEFQRLEGVAARMRELIRARVRVSEADAHAHYARENQKVVVDYVSLDRGYYRDHVLDTGKEAIAAWAEVHKDDVDKSWDAKKASYEGGCRRVRHILAAVNEEDPDGPEVAKKKAHEKVDGWKKRIDAGEKFADVAREVSDDARTKKKGGDLGCFAAGKLAAPNTTKAVDDAAFALEKGKISEPIEDEPGVHLVIVDDVLDGEAAAKLGRGEATRELYLQLESERLTSEAARQILAAVKDGKALEQALDDHLVAVLPEEARKVWQAGRDAEKAGGDKKDAEGNDAWTDAARPRVRTSDPFTSTTAPFGQIEKGPDAAKMLFELQKPGEVGRDIIKLFDGYAVAQLKERQAADEKVWTEHRNDFLDEALRDKQRDALVAYMLRLREQIAKEVQYKVPLDDAEPPKDEGGEG
jgi:peptidyl-prolyl cis-trans isomerase D